MGIGDGRSEARPGRWLLGREGGKMLGADHAGALELGVLKAHSDSEGRSIRKG